MIKNITTLLASACLGIVSLGAVACDDDGTAAGSPAPSATAPAAIGGATSAAPASPGVSSPGVSPPSAPTSRPKVTGSQVIMIDPSGKKYTRKLMIELAAGMAAASGKKGLPADFCAQSYQQGVDGGGKFPLGRYAFMEACQEGLRLAG
ncbi:hypothetical protein ACRYCC_22185 [Actinomadura scrupuli]|uniref:hypothetical protein n=1 Tax=Actinomadura scrupuli TaxID=559629 RepID=UPI003D98514D